MVDNFRSAYPEKYQSQNRVNNAIRDGKLTKGTVCEVCGRNADELEQQGLRIEAHHYLGYAKEHQLDVQWLCNFCHKQADMAKDDGEEPEQTRAAVSAKRFKTNPPPQVFLDAARVFAEMEDGLHGEPDEWDYPPVGAVVRQNWEPETKALVPGKTSNHPVSHEQILLEVGFPVEKAKIPRKPPAWMTSPEFRSVVGQYRKYQAALRLPESFKISNFLRPISNELAMLLYTRIKQSQLGIGKPIPDSTLFSDGWKIMRALGEKDGEIKQAGVTVNIANFELLPEESRKEALAAYFANAQQQAEQQLLETEEEIIEGEIVDE